MKIKAQRIKPFLSCLFLHFYKEVKRWLNCCDWTVFSLLIKAGYIVVLKKMKKPLRNAFKSQKANLKDYFWINELHFNIWLMENDENKRKMQRNVAKMEVFLTVNLPLAVIYFMNSSFFISRSSVTLQNQGSVLCVSAQWESTMWPQTVTSGGWTPSCHFTSHFWNQRAFWMQDRKNSGLISVYRKCVHHFHPAGF